MMLLQNVLRIAETFVLLLTVVRAFNLDATAACLRAKLDFESKGIYLFEITTNAAPGILILFSSNLELLVKIEANESLFCT